MTLREAFRLQDRFKAKYGGTGCTHGDLVDPLFSEKGQDIGFLVCLICGDVYVERDKPLSPTEFQAVAN